MTGRSIRDFLVDFGLFLIVAIVTTIVGTIAYAIHPSFWVGTIAMTIAAVILVPQIQLRVWVGRIEARREEIAYEAGALARREEEGATSES